MCHHESGWDYIIRNNDFLSIIIRQPELATVFQKKTVVFLFWAKYGCGIAGRTVIQYGSGFLFLSSGTTNIE